MGILKSKLNFKLVRRIMILGFSLVIIASAIFSRTNRLPGKIAGSATSSNPLLIDNKFCDDPSNVNQASCTSFISTSLAQATPAPVTYQNVVGDVSIAGKVTVSGNGIYNSSGYQLLEANATDWIRIGQGGQFPYGAAIYNNIASNGGLALGLWEKPPPGAIWLQNAIVADRTTYWQVGPNWGNNFGITKVVNGTNTEVGVYLSPGGTSWWGYSSDQRLKTNIKTLSHEDGLAAIKKLNPVSFNWLSKESSKKTQLGFIGQQVQKIFPELVSEGSDATVTLSDGTKKTIQSPLVIGYTGIIPPLVKAVQELDQKNQVLEEKVNNQQKEIEGLKREIQELRQR